MDKHISTQFDSELRGVSSRVLEMGGLVEAQIRLAIEALALMNADVAYKVIEAEEAVNQFEVDIDRELSSIIARRQPTARDLRLLMAISRTTANLERVGDEAERMARMVQSICKAGATLRLPSGDLRVASDLAAKQLRKALNAFARLDATDCVSILREDDLIDQEFNGFVRRLITYMMEDPRTISASLDLLFIAKAIERIGDHAKNIAECVIYIVKGADVRHSSMEDIETAVKYRHMKKPYILIVEDEAAIAELVAINLRHAGFECDVAVDSAAAQSSVFERLPDLVLLDWMLPTMSGFSLAKQWRGQAETKLLPIIMLTARAEEIDKVASLDAGVDDYITKPFSNKELLARVRAVLRRRAPDIVVAAATMSMGVISLDGQAHRVTAEGKEVKLAPTEFKLLTALLQQGDKVLKRETLQNMVWGHYNDIDERTVDVHIKRLREALTAVSSLAAAQVQTIRGMGYRLSRTD